MAVRGRGQAGQKGEKESDGSVVCDITTPQPSMQVYRSKQFRNLPPPHRHTAARKLGS